MASFLILWDGCNGYFAAVGDWVGGGGPELTEETQRDVCRPQRGCKATYANYLLEVN